jgi:hypothetical protein
VLTAFVFGSIGAFLLFPWPPVIRETVLIVLAYVVILAFAESVGRVLIAPGAKHDYFRVLPLSQPLAQFWFMAMKWMVRLVGGAWATLSLLKIIGVSVLSRQVIAGCWFTVIAVALLVLLAVRLHRVDAPKPSRVGTVLFATLVLLGWMLAALHMRAAFWTLIVMTCLPALMGAVRTGIHNVMRLDDNQDGTRSAAVAWSVVVERSLRVLLVLAGASILAEVWGIDIGEIAVTECQMVNQFAGSRTEPAQFTRGYGLVFGHGERRAMSMALVDRGLRARELGEEADAPAQQEEFVLYHSDNIEATGFVEHLKLPHYVDFQSELENLRTIRRAAEAELREAAE